MTAHGIMFHHFHDDRHPSGQGSMSADELVRMIRYLGPERILSAEVWMERALAGSLTADDLCFTFDDALRCQYDIALPVLEDYGITAFWFVYSSVFEGGLELLEIYRYFRSTEFDDVDDFYKAFFADAAKLYPGAVKRGFVDFDPSAYLVDFPFYTNNDRIFRYLRDDVLGPEKYARVMQPMIAKAGYDMETLRTLLWLTDGQLANLAASGHVIGLHSYSHPTVLERLPADAQRLEYRRNYDHLSRVVGAAPHTVAHPCNSYGPETLEILRDLGVKLGFRANTAGPARSPFEFPREDHANVLKAMAQ